MLRRSSHARSTGPEPRPHVATELRTALTVALGTAKAELRYGVLPRCSERCECVLVSIEWCHNGPPMALVTWVSHCRRISVYACV